MSRTENLKHLLSAEVLFIPFEDNAGLKQVSSIAYLMRGKYFSLDFVDDDRVFLGGVRLLQSRLDSEQVKAGIEAFSSALEQIVPDSIRVVDTSRLLDGSLVSGIEELSFLDKSSRCLTLTQVGARYSFSFVLEVKQTTSAS